MPGVRSRQGKVITTGLEVSHIEAARRFAPAPESIAAVRRFVVSSVQAWDSAADVEVAALLTSEVITNAVVHAGPHAPGDVIRVRVLRSIDAIRVEVTDGHSGTPVLGDGATHKPSGRGIMIVDALASRWGAERNGEGKVVWFEVAA